GSLDTPSLTSQQFLAINGPDVGTALKINVIATLIRDVAFGPAFLIAILALFYFAVHDRPIRVWALLLFTPLALLGAVMLATFSVPMAAPFRIDGVWTLLLVPFAAWVVVWLAQRIARLSARRYLLSLSCAMFASCRLRSACRRSREMQSGETAM